VCACACACARVRAFACARVCVCACVHLHVACAHKQPCVRVLCIPCPETCLLSSAVGKAHSVCARPARQAPLARAPSADAAPLCSPGANLCRSACLARELGTLVLPDTNVRPSACLAQAWLAFRHLQRPPTQTFTPLLAWHKPGGPSGTFSAPQHKLSPLCLLGTRALWAQAETLWIRLDYVDQKKGRHPIAKDSQLTASALTPQHATHVPRIPPRLPGKTQCRRFTQPLPLPLPTFLARPSCARAAGMDVCVRKPLIASCSTDKSVRLWNYNDRTCELVKWFPDEIFSIAIHPSGLQVQSLRPLHAYGLCDVWCLVLHMASLRVCAVDGQGAQHTGAAHNCSAAP